MGFDIYAIENVLWESGDEIAYHRAYMGAFRMMREQGYDWFNLIDAEECNGGVSGNGTEKFISGRFCFKCQMENIKEMENGKSE